MIGRVWTRSSPHYFSSSVIIGLATIWILDNNAPVFRWLWFCFFLLKQISGFPSCLIFLSVSFSLLFSYFIFSFESPGKRGGPHWYRKGSDFLSQHLQTFIKENPRLYTFNFSFSDECVRMYLKTILEKEPHWQNGRSRQMAKWLPRHECWLRTVLFWRHASIIYLFHRSLQIRHLIHLDLSPVN